MTYASNIEEINSTRRKINISVPATSVKDALHTVTNEMQTTSEIRGFRKGKAPLTMVRKFYMNDIVKKAADKLINDAYTTTIKGVDFQIVSQPHIEPVNQFTENDEFKFSATVDINPKLEMKDYKNISVKLPKSLDVSLEDKYNEVIASFQKTMGTTSSVEEVRPAQKGDFAKISYSMFVNGKELSTKKTENQLVEISTAIFPEIESALIGSKAGESKVVTVHVPENHKDTSLAGKNIEFHLTLNSIESMVLAELNDELAKKIGYESMEVAKTKIFEDIKHTHEEMKANAAFEQIVDQVLAKNEFEVAECLVESTLDRAVEEARHNETKPTRESFKELALRNVRGILALGHIARQEGVAVTDQEVSQDLIQFARANQIDLRQLLQNGSQTIEEFRGQLMIRKVLVKLLDFANIEYTDSPESTPAV